ncbi:MAG TPA: T9SS type A sorting domain-containing protein [Bacteroidia bacterium]|nr:T9SS type A sorting domain-containing protein [Bacteroidia bacterium]
MGDVKKYKAYNTLAISNTSIAGALTNGGVADFSARTDVNVLNNYEFHAEAGSEVHLFIENTLWDCNDLEFVNYNKLNNKVPDADENNSDLRFIELCFKREINDFTFEVLPNPGKDIISISISSESTSEYKFELCDLLGQSVLKGIASYPNVIVNLTSFNSGIYLLKVKQDNLEKTKRVSIIK